MTPDDLLDELRKMFVARRFSEMVDLTVRVLPDVKSQMTPDHAAQLHEFMHFADMADDLGAADSARHQTEEAARTS